MTTVHRALAPTRGGAAALSRIDAPERLLRFIGIGNIAAAIIHDGVTRRMVSHNGVAGHVAPHIREFTYPWHPGDTIIMHSDGLSAKWDMADYPGLALSHPSLIAAILFRDHRRTEGRRLGGRHDEARHEDAAAQHRDRARDRHRSRAAAGAQDREPRGLRCAGPDADHHGAVRDRAQCLGICRRRPRRVLVQRGQGAKPRDRGAGQGQRHRRYRGGSRRDIPIEYRHGARHPRRAPSDGKFRDPDRSAARHDGAHGAVPDATRADDRPGGARRHRQGAGEVGRDARSAGRDPAPESGSDGRSSTSCMGASIS